MIVAGTAKESQATPTQEDSDGHEIPRILVMSLDDPRGDQVVPASPVETGNPAPAAWHAASEEQETAKK